jgi:hypothetical protein
MLMQKENFSDAEASRQTKIASSMLNSQVVKTKNKPINLTSAKIEL